MFNKETYTAELLYDFENDLSHFELVSTSLGPHQEICALLVDRIPERINGMFPSTKTDEGHTYKVIKVNNDCVQELVLHNQQWNYHFVQPIDRDRYLLVCARSQFYSKENYELNGKIFDAEGKFIHEFLLGDGIQDVKATARNQIWTSYFDEGIFGNYGWDDPVGSTGLRSWGMDGTPIYVHPTYEMADCYALNVVSDNEVWFYYYTEFQLASLIDNKLTYYKTGISGADGFAIYGEYVLFRGGYGKRDDYTLFKLESGRLRKLKSIRIHDDEGMQIKADRVDCRGANMLIQAGSKAYLVNLKEIVNQL